MKPSTDHRPPRKQRELSRILDILHEEFEDALKQGTADRLGSFVELLGDWATLMMGRRRSIPFPGSVIPANARSPTSS
jgi:hypothetical protein